MSVTTRPTMSELVKAVILVLDERGIPTYPIPVLFNPTEYRIDTSNQYSQTSLPGTEEPVTQWVRSEAERLSMTLFVDTAELGVDVRLYTDRIDDLLAVEGERHAPQICRFIWGTLNFKSVLLNANKRFTMFLPGGFPVRAEVDVTFQRYDTLTSVRARTKRESADRTKTRLVVEGDTLPLVAAEEYGDPGQWRPIAEANGIDDPRTLEAGRELVIPPLES